MEYLNKHAEKDVVLCLQEPHIKDKGISRLHKEFEAFWATGTGLRPRALIIAPKRLGGYMVSQHTGRDCVTIRLVKGTISVVCFYCDIDVPVRLSWQLALMECNVNQRVIMCSDANASHSAWGGGRGHARGRQRGVEYMEIIDEANLHICNVLQLGPTFIGPGDRRSFIDLTQCTDPCIDKITDWTIMGRDFGSDHRAIFFKYGARVKGEGFGYKEVKSIPWKKPTTKGKSMMEKELPKKVTYYKKVNTVEELQRVWTGHVNNIQKALGDLFPKRKNKARVECYWWTRQVEQAHGMYQKARRKMRKEAKRTGEISDELKQEVRRRRGKWRYESKQAKVESWRRYTSDINDPWGGIYKVLKSVDRGRSKNTTLCDLRGYHGPDMLSTLHLLARQFFPELPHETEEHVIMANWVRDKLEQYDEGPGIGKWEYREALNTMSESSAPGDDGITTNVIRILSHAGWEARYRALFSASLRLSYVPSEWKRAKIVLIPKAGAPNATTKSMRPISLTAIHGKLMERIVNQRIVYEVERGGRMATTQHAYRKGGSTTTALFEAVKFIEAALERKWVCQAVFLDISGAFDRAWHTGILFELLHLGTPKYLVAWIRNYLAGRTARLEAGGEEVNVQLTQGCPQGGVLSPLLWNVVFNKFLLMREEYTPAGAPPIQIIGYADDALVLCQARTCVSATARLQRHLKRIKEWAESYRVVFNPAKMFTMQFGKGWKRRSAGTNSGLKFGGVDITTVEQYRYLGVILDNGMKWGAQVRDCMTKLGSMTRMLRGAVREKWGIKMQILKILYDACFKPVMTYALPIWMAGVQTKTIQNKFDRLIRAYAGMATRTFKTSSTEVVLQIMGIRPFKETLEEEAMRTSLIQLQLSATQRDGRNLACPKVVRLMKQSHALLDPLVSEVQHINLQHYYFEHPKEWMKPDCRYADRIPSIWSSVDNSGWIIYTDASATSYGRGWAVAMYWQGFLTWSNYGSLKLASVFTTELYAVWQAAKAIRMIHLGERGTSVEIRTDSLACIRALHKTTQVDPNLRLCWLELKQRVKDGYQVVLRWTPGHEGVEGNQQADRIARRGVDSSIQSAEMHTAVRDVQRLIRRKMEHLEEIRFRSIGSSVFRNFIPNRVAMSTFRSEARSYQVCQLITGHCRLNHFMNKVGAVEGIACSCGADDETVQHYLCNCPNFREVRAEVWGKEMMEWEEVLRDGWRKIEQYVEETGRLRRTDRDE